MPPMLWASMHFFGGANPYLLPIEIAVWAIGAGLALHYVLDQAGMHWMYRRPCPARLAPHGVDVAADCPFPLDLGVNGRSVRMTLGDFYAQAGRRVGILAGD